jgi:uncharacterized sporulation protein YeaH/YhbH (DUF444 family)
MDIDRDLRRFKDIVRRDLRDDLKDHIQRGNLDAQHGDETISIPIDKIDLPKFTHGSQKGGVGQGDGEPGDKIDGDPQEGDDGDEAGDEAGDHSREVEVSYEELADIMAEKLELPRIEPKGDDQVETETYEYRGMNETGPETLRDFKATYKEALKREIATGDYDPDDPEVIPIQDDTRYRMPEEVEDPEFNAAIIYMMDVSGSMGGKQKDIVRNLSFWIDTWIRSQYDGIDSRYIMHDAQAKEADRETFFSTSAGGGTIVSSAYKLCAKIIEDDYPSHNWNIYTFHFSDGDNWSNDDTVTSVDILDDKIVPQSNLFAYGQVDSAHGTGRLIKPIRNKFQGHENVATHRIRSQDDVYGAIQTFLGEGR